MMQPIFDGHCLEPREGGVWASNITYDKFVHSSNASKSILFTFLGIVMDFKLLQPLNALSPILVILSGRVIDFNEEQL